MKEKKKNGEQQNAVSRIFTYNSTTKVLTPTKTKIEFYLNEKVKQDDQNTQVSPKTKKCNERKKEKNCSLTVGERDQCDVVSHHCTLHKSTSTNQTSGHFALIEKFNRSIENGFRR